MRATSRVAAVVVVLGWTVSPAFPALGAEGTPCTGEADLTISPGLSNSPSSGTWTADERAGTITCTGKVNGYDVTGPGTFGGHGRYGTKDPDTCGGGEAEGIHLISIPTSSGTQNITNEHSAVYGPLKGGAVVGGEFTGPRFSGTFEARPVEGDCVTAPMTKVHFTVKGTMED